MATTVKPPGTSPTVSTANFARYAWAVLAYNIAVVLWGAFVRATGSGAGCGNHWPLCNGAVVPVAPTLKTVIEFTHRATSGIDLALVAILVAWAFLKPFGYAVRLGAVLSGVFLLTEALLGAALVLLEHVAKNASANRAWSLSAHLINTLTLLACLTLTVWWAKGNPRLRPRGKPAWIAGATLGSVMLLGVSGAIAALGDTLFPARTLAEGLAQDFDATANIFVRLRVWHPFLAVGVVFWVLWIGTGTVGRVAALQPNFWWVAGLLGAQVIAGGLNMVLLAPVWLQMVHLLLADALWIALVLFFAEMLKQTPQTADNPV